MCHFDKPLETSSARSATLEDTIRALLHLASWNLQDSQFIMENFPDSQLHLESKTESNVSKAELHWGGRGGGHHTEKV